MRGGEPGEGSTQRQRRQRKTRCENTPCIASATIWVGNYGSSVLSVGAIGANLWNRWMLFCEICAVCGFPLPGLNRYKKAPVFGGRRVRPGLPLFSPVV